MTNQMTFREAVALPAAEPWFVAIVSKETEAVEAYAILNSRDPETYTDGDFASLQEACYHALSDRNVAQRDDGRWVLLSDANPYEVR